MTEDPADHTREHIGRWLKFGVIGGAVVALLLVTFDTDRHPRTDDASVRANFIAIAPEVGGRLIKLPVKDNALVKKVICCSRLIRATTNMLFSRRSPIRTIWNSELSIRDERSPPRIVP